MSNTSKSSEDYLETILLIEKSKGEVKSIDIANMKKVSRPSVNKALKTLINLGYVKKESYGNVYLTDLGREKALSIHSKHSIINNFLIKVLGVTPLVAEKDACHIEHILSDETLNKLNIFLNNYL
ncbi:MAG: metal-dependent transcriptional regulator [Clostridium sp.]